MVLANENGPIEFTAADDGVVIYDVSKLASW